MPGHDAALGYLAGIIDGEGTVYWNAMGARGTVYLRVVNTDRPLIDWILEYTGCGNVYTHDDWGELGDKTIWAWTVNGARAASLLQVLAPLLIVKRERVAEVLAQWEASRPHLVRPGRRLAAEARAVEEFAARGIA